ncbi:MAG: acetylglutamate kinase [Chloroflexota bacterium]
MVSPLKDAIVVKIGGSTLGSKDTTLEDIITLQKQGKPVIVIHGGGKIITDWLTRLGVKTNFVQGERVTDAQSLEVVNAVLSGLVNKDLVAQLNNMGGRAVGISGADGALVQGDVANPEMGYVGRTVKVDARLLETLVAVGFIPVISPISLYSQDRQEESPGLLNNNADTIAGEIAEAIGAKTLVFLTDVAGILDKQGKLIPELTPKSAEELIKSGVASGGMIPKIRACARAVRTTGSASIIDGRKPHALIQEMLGSYPGTKVVAK